MPQPGLVAGARSSPWQVIVAVNKLDMVGWSQERFDLITAKVGEFLKKQGFKPKVLPCCPHVAPILPTGHAHWPFPGSFFLALFWSACLLCYSRLGIAAPSAAARPCGMCL